MAQRFGRLLRSPDGTTVEVHQPPIRHGVRNDHTAARPIPRGMRPGAWCGIAHPQLLGQRQRNAALAEVRCAATAGEGGLKPVLGCALYSAY